MGSGTRAELRIRVGFQIPKCSRIPRSWRKKAVAGRRALHALRKRSLRVFLLRLVPRAAGWGSRSLPSFCEHAERGENPVSTANPHEDKPMLDEPPPVLGTWPNVYRFVLAY